MVLDKMENLTNYLEANPLLWKVAGFMRDFEKNGMKDGTYEIDGKHVYAMIQSYRTKPQTPDMMFEAHRKYIDLQYIVSGIEKMRWAKLSSVDLVREEYSKGNDIAFYEGDALFDFTLTAGSFIMFYPQDAHLPGLSADKDVNVRKIVFKIEV